MKTLLTTFSLAGLLTASVNGQVWINEILANPPGSDSTAALGLELFELRGTPNMSLAGYYLLSLEGQGTTGKGDINQLFNLGAYSIGANGYLIALQNNSPYTPAAGATVVRNTFGQGWGTNSNTTIPYQADGNPNQLDLENSATTILLVNAGAGAAPTLTTDLDTEGDGVLDLPAEWTILDSVGLMDGAGALAGDVSYGSITFRVGSLGTSTAGNIITVLDTVPGSQNLYAARKGNSTGSTADDWVGSYLTGSGGNFTFGANTTDPYYTGKPIADMLPGGANAIPEPAAASLVSLGLLALCGFRRRA